MLCPSAFEGSVRRRYEGRLYFALQLDPPIPPKYKVNSLHFPCIWFGLAWIQLGLAWFGLAALGLGAAFLDGVALAKANNNINHPLYYTPHRISVSISSLRPSAFCTPRPSPSSARTTTRTRSAFDAA